MALRIELVSQAEPSAQVRDDSCLPAAVGIVVAEAGWWADAHSLQERLLRDLGSPERWTDMEVVAARLREMQIPAAARNTVPGAARARHR